MSEKKLLSCLEASKIVGMDAGYIRHLCKRGVINARKIGNSWVISERALAQVKRQRKPRKLTESH